MTDGIIIEMQEDFSQYRFPALERVYSRYISMADPTAVDIWDATSLSRGLSFSRLLTARLSPARQQEQRYPSTSDWGDVVNLAPAEVEHVLYRRLSPNLNTRGPREYLREMLRRRMLTAYYGGVLAGVKLSPLAESIADTMLAAEPLIPREGWLSNFSGFVRTTRPVEFRYV